MTNKQKSKQENEHGHQNQEPKKGQSPNDLQNRERDPKHARRQEKSPQEKQPQR